MSNFTLQRGAGNNQLIKKNLSLATNPSINSNNLLSSNLNPSFASLSINNVLLTATSNELNFTDTTPGTAEGSKALILDSSRNITNINNISCSSLIVNGTTITGASSGGGSSNTYVGVTPGIGIASKGLLLNNSRNISNINKLSITGNLSKKYPNIPSQSIITKNLSGLYIRHYQDTYTNEWVTQTPTEQNNWESICWAQNLGLFCAISSNGTNRVMISSDSINWSNGSMSGIDLNSWKSICWSPELNLFCAVSSDGSNRVMISSNGINWTSYGISNGVSLQNWQSICWSPELGLFCAVSQNGSPSIITSVDGITWSSQTSEISGWRSVCWSSELGLFIAVASSGTNRVMRSSDGINWLISSVSGVDANEWISICWSPELGLFCAVSQTGSNRIMTSLDGITWISRTVSDLNLWDSICWSSELGLFCAVSLDGNNRLMISKNGINWTSKTIPNTNTWNAICWSSELQLFCVVGQNSVLINKKAILIDTYGNIDIAFHNGVDKGLELNGELIKSTALQLNYLNTTPGTASSNKALVLDSSRNITNLNNINCSSIIVNGVLITDNTVKQSSISVSGIASASKGIILDSSRNITNINTLSTTNNIIKQNPNSKPLSLITKSTSGKLQRHNMTQCMTNLQELGDPAGGSSREWQSVCWSPELGLFCAVASTNTSTTVMISYNGMDWFGYNAANQNAWNSVCWSPELGLFVAVASSGTNRVMYSSNGTSWTGTGTGVDANTWRSVCWSPELGLFVAVANSGTNRVMYSSNGLSWSSTGTGVDANGWISVCWSPELGLFVAVANSGTNRVMYSSNGTSWISTSSGVSVNSWSSVCWSPELRLFCAISLDGTNRVMYSSNGTSWTSTSSGVPTNPWASICWSPELLSFVAITNSATSNRVMYSFNGINWTGTSAGPSNYSWNSICWSSELNMLCAVQKDTLNSPKIWISTNFNNFKYRIKNNGIFRMSTINSLRFNSSIITSNGSKLNYVDVTTYGIAEANKALILNSSRDITNINELNCSQLILNGTTLTYTLPMIQSISGIAESYKVLTLDASNNISNINYLTATGNIIKKNISGKSQSFITSGLTGNYKRHNRSANNIITNIANDSSNWESICWSPQLGIFCAVASSGTNRVSISSNGSNWSLYGISNGINANAWQSVCWSPELMLFVAVANSGTNRVMISQNGINWTSYGESNGMSLIAWTSICWISELGKFCISSNTSTTNILVSSDGINWQTITFGDSAAIKALCWSPELQLMVMSSSSDIYTSSDLLNWTKNTITNISTTNITWSPDLGLFCAVGTSTPRGLTSPDGINWTNRSLNITQNYTSISWSSELGLFCAMSNSGIGGVMSTSPDGITWTDITIPNQTWTSICWSSELNIFCAVSNSSTNRILNYGGITRIPSRVGIGINPSFQIQLSSDSAAKPSSTSWTVGSDIRLKEDIQDADLNICFDNIKNLKLKYYKWKNDIYTNEQVSDRHQLGWLADDVEEIIPKAITITENHGISNCKNLNIDQIIASMYGATQKLMNKVESIDNYIKNLEIE